MTEPAGLEGPLPSVFEDGLRLLAAALALKADQRSLPAATTAACGSLRCFLKILEEAARRHCPDPQGDLLRLRAQCGALLTTGQVPGDALDHALEAARLARDEAARVLVQLVSRGPGA
jgi:hypothetical protein